MEPTYEELLAIGERIGNVKKKGLSTNQLKKLPAAKISKTVPLKSTECVICLEDFNQRVLVTTLACDHSFHKKCISDWLKRNAACPICRREVKE
ncbi:hypothetical protein BC833DRAFT_613310 [Globomyces pollinis-pini]|nr:hypothetical protein BC833DRAFT_613310 [Globomyces pollinis-pini]